MSDQASLPVTFPPGTELPIKGKVEVTGGKIEVTNFPALQKVEVTNAELTVKVAGESTVKVNGEVSVKVTNTPKVEVSNIPEVKLAAGSTIEVSGKVEVTNTVKVEGVAASPVAIKNGAEAGQASVAQKRLLITEGRLKVRKNATVATNKATVEITALEHATNTYQLEAIHAEFFKGAQAEKTVYGFLIEILMEGVILYEEAIVTERIGTGSAEVVTRISYVLGANPSLVWMKIGSGFRCYITRPLPSLSCGGAGISSKVIIESKKGTTEEPFKEEGLEALNGRMTVISNEGTL